MTFIKGLREPKTRKDKAYWFVFQAYKILVRHCDKDRYTIPLSSNLKNIPITPLRTQYLGLYNGVCCYSAEVVTAVNISKDLTFLPLRNIFTFIDEDMLRIAFYALQIIAWDRDFQFCGRCGSHTINMKNERAKLCQDCGQVSYPRKSPAIIVAIIRDHKILLARSAKFKDLKMFSVLAGFVEPGENLEECVQREIREEVGIEVKNIKYFGSQEWPFPDSLMIGFIAEYAGGTITPDNHEVIEAGWFAPAALPKIPSSISIARKLIDWFIDQETAKKKADQ